MDQPRLFKIIGMPILIALIIAGLINFMSSSADTYDVDYNSSEMEEIKESGEKFNQITQEADDKSSVKVTQDDYDKSGSIMRQGLDALNTVTQSYDLFASLFGNSLKNLGMGSYGRTAKIVFISLITTLIVLGIILTAVVRRRI